jgi:hypothetical protein
MLPADVVMLPADVVMLPADVAELWTGRGEEAAATRETATLSEAGTLGHTRHDEPGKQVELLLAGMRRPLWPHSPDSHGHTAVLPDGLDQRLF